MPCTPLNLPLNRRDFYRPRQGEDGRGANLRKERGRRGRSPDYVNDYIYDNEYGSCAGQQRRNLQELCAILRM